MFCAVCTAPWHPETGMIVGSPQRFRMCGRCWREAFATLKQYASRTRFKGRTVVFYGELPASPLGAVPGGNG